MTVWLATLRRGIAWHVIEGRRTVCGRYVGDPAFPPARGYVMDQAEALDQYAATECKTCMGDAVRRDPTGVPSRDRGRS